MREFQVNIPPPPGPQGNDASLINTHIGLSRVPALRVETATSSGVAVVNAAYAAIAAGLCDKRKSCDKGKSCGKEGRAWAAGRHD